METRTSPFCPQYDGLVERFNRILLDILSHWEERQNTWNQKLHQMMLVYRTSQHESTKHFPLLVMFGTEVCFNFDVQTSCRFDKEYINTLWNSLNSDHEKVREYLNASHKRPKPYYNRNARPHNYI